MSQPISKHFRSPEEMLSYASLKGRETVTIGNRGWKTFDRVDSKLGLESRPAVC